MRYNILNLTMLSLFIVVMNYRFTRNFWHEILGIILLGLFFVHTFWHIKWFTTLNKGKWPVGRIIMTLLNASLVISVIILTGTGLMISRLLPYISSGFRTNILVHQLHSLSAYTTFLLAAVHFGLHADMLIAKLRSQLAGRRGRIYSWAGYLTSMIVIIYGIQAFIDRNILGKLLMQHMAGWGKAVSFWSFTLDYLAIIGLCVCLTYYIKHILHLVFR